MRLNCKIFFIGIMMLFLSFGAKANADTLTIGQAFNWQVGDSFIYKAYQWKMPNGPGLPRIYQYGVPIGFSVQNKITRNDSLLYTLNYSDGFVANIGFTKLDSPMYQLLDLDMFPFFCRFLDSMPTCDSSWANCTSATFNDSTFFNRLTIHQNYVVYTTGYFYDATQNVGIRQAEFNSEEFVQNAPYLQNGGCGGKMIYYQSGNDVWADSALLYPATGINDLSFDPNAFSIYPNPASNIIQVERNVPASVKAEIRIYDAAGRTVLSSMLNERSGTSTLDISTLDAGLYVINISNENGLSIYRSRLIKQ